MLTRYVSTEYTTCSTALRCSMPTVHNIATHQVPQTAQRQAMVAKLASRHGGQTVPLVCTPSLQLMWLRFVFLHAAMPTQPDTNHAMHTCSRSCSRMPKQHLDVHLKNWCFLLSCAVVCVCHHPWVIHPFVHRCAEGSGRLLLAVPCSRRNAS